MKKKWRGICLFSLIFLFFFAGAVNEVWDRHTLSHAEFIQLADNDDLLERFNGELLFILAEALPDKESFDAVCETVYLQESIYHDEALIILYLEKDDGKNAIIWTAEKRRLKTPKAIREAALDAAYLLLYRLNRDLPAEKVMPIFTPIKKAVL